jgi:hypothetical protein
MYMTNCTNGWTLKKPASGDPDEDVIGETIEFSPQFLQESMKQGWILWAPRLGVRCIVTVYRILGEDFVTLPSGPFFRGLPVCVAGPH